MDSQGCRAGSASVAAAAKTVKAKGVTLYGLVNNAGVGLAHGDVGGAAAILNTNFYGVCVYVRARACGCVKDM